jgi:hypothetical protein
MKFEEALQQLKVARKARRLQSLWPSIEVKLAEGVSHAEILVLLNQNGFALTERTYKSYLYRYRKRRRAAGQRRDPTSAIEKTKTQPADAVPAAACLASAAVDTHKRPPSFDFDPRGISPELLK